MLKKYNIKAGLVFSFLIAVLSSFPRLIRLDFDILGRSSRNFIYFFTCLFVCWLIHNFFLLSGFTHPFLKHNTRRAIISILAGVFFIVLITYVFNVISVMPIVGIPHDKMTIYQVLAIRLFRGAIISAFAFFAAYYFRMMTTLQRSKLENEYLKQENLKAQLATLKEQISPHFLFNSLNTLSTLSHETVVKEYILKMSEVYRYVLHYQEQQEVPVKEELAFIQSYTYILETRFEDGISVNVNVSPDKLNRKILPFALQLLVENAIKHNTISYQKPLVIDIYDHAGGIAVENVFRPRGTMDRQSGIGLNNLAQRYKLACGKDISISRNPDKFKVEIPFLV